MPNNNTHAAGLFLSYRRNDEAGYVGRLVDGLSSAFGDDAVFRDVDDLVPGRDWQVQLEKQLQGTSIVLAVIGKNWASELVNKRATSSVENPDILQFELNRADSLNIPVMPVLLPEAELPDEQILGNLQWLRGKHMFKMSDGQNRWAHDLETLTAQIESLTNLRRITPSFLTHYRLPAALLFMLVVVTAVILATRSNDIPDSVTSGAGHASDLPMPLGELAHNWEETDGLAVFLDAANGSIEERILHNLQFPAGSGIQGKLIAEFCDKNESCVQCAASPATASLQDSQLVTIKLKKDPPVTEQEMRTADGTGNWPISDNNMPWENIDKATGKRTLFVCAAE